MHYGPTSFVSAGGGEEVLIPIESLLRERVDISTKLWAEKNPHQRAVLIPICRESEGGRLFLVSHQRIQMRLR